MNYGQSFRLALKSLTTSKMRSLLTMLGIIIGVASVIIILALGNGVQGMIDEQVEKLLEYFAGRLILGISDEMPSRGNIERVKHVRDLVAKHNAACGGNA